MGRVVDLRGDNAARPTEEMLQVMVSAETGRYLPEEDPEVAALEQEAATYLGQEMCLYLPTVTMGNLIALLVHTRPGDRVLIPDNCHMLVAEGGGWSALAGVRPVPLPGVDLAGATEALADDRAGEHSISVLWVENTHTRAGGAVVEPDRLHAAAAAAREAGIPLHLDGARLPNAAAASGVAVSTLGSVGTSVCLSLNKGLGAPVGGVLAGPEAFIARARSIRQRLGGAWRQAGNLAAAARVALQTDLAAIRADHERACKLGRTLAELDGWSVPPVATNIVLAHCTNGAVENGEQRSTAAMLVEALATRDVLITARSASSVRLVTHYSVGDAELAHAVSAIRAVGSIVAQAT